MSTTPEQIDIWRSAKKETQRLEFKEAKKQYDNKKLYKYCVALANEGGGQLFLGVADRPPRPVVGTSAFQDPVAMAEKLFEAIGFRVDIEEVEHPDGRVLVFHIPSRPRGTAYHLHGAYLMRAGESLVPMSEDQLRRIFAEGAPDWLEQPCRDGITEQEAVALLDTQSFFDLLELPYPADRTGVLARLKQEHLIDDSATGLSIRRIAALLLAKDLNDFPDISRKAARLVVYSGVSKVETRLDEVFSRGYAVGFQELVKLVMAQLPQNEVINDSLRREETLVPSIAIRELIANALIHQDFSISGVSAMFEIYSDRVEISSPGEPIVPLDRFIDGYRSRNERLADLMRRFAICEEKSSGIDKVVQAAEVYQLPAPEFRQGFRRTEVILYGPKSFGDMTREARVRACYQHCALQYVLRREMTNQSLRKRFDLPSGKIASVSQTIAATVEAGLIKSSAPDKASNRYRQYIPIWA
jgi:ATP-dependent DNA helicase RecG